MTEIASSRTQVGQARPTCALLMSISGKPEIDAPRNDAESHDILRRACERDPASEVFRARKSNVRCCANSRHARRRTPIFAKRQNRL